MKHSLFLLPLLLAGCTQNQLILDPFDEGESLMVQDEDAIAYFEGLMADVGTDANIYKIPAADSRAYFNSPDVLSTFQDTQPILGICRSGDKEYYYHIEKDYEGTMLTDLDQGITDYVVTPEKYEQIREFIRVHTPVPPEYEASTEETETQEAEE